LLAALVCVTSLIFATNDIVLIVLWTLASLENPAYIPVVVNFTIFFFNDMYGFISWQAPGDFDGSVRTIRLIIKHGFIQKFCF
jgi:hypothetical protein